MFIILTSIYICILISNLIRFIYVIFKMQIYGQIIYSGRIIFIICSVILYCIIVKFMLIWTNSHLILQDMATVPVGESPPFFWTLLDNNFKLGFLQDQVATVLKRWHIIFVHIKAMFFHIWCICVAHPKSGVMVFCGFEVRLNKFIVHTLIYGFSTPRI